MVANILLADPGDGVSRSKLIFLERVHVAYQFKANREKHQIICKFNLSEHGDVAYQMKGNHSRQEHGSKYPWRVPTTLPRSLGHTSHRGRY